jgi:predicted permease
MGDLRRFVRRLWNALAPGRAERELSREMAAHIGLIEDEYRRRGLTPDEARRAARRDLGGLEQTRNGQRDSRSFVWLDDLRRDTAYAVRTLSRTPIFTGVAILTLGLGIGATTAIFSVVDHVLVRSLPLPHADRLVRLYESNPTAKRLHEGTSPAHAADWRRMASSFEFVALIGGTNVTMTGAAEPEAITAMTVGPEFFALTGVTLALGHPFDESEYTSIANAGLGPLTLRETATGKAAVILSHALWQRQFGGDPHVVGRMVTLNEIPAEIAGVMPAGFRFDQSPWGTAECWLPHVPSKMMPNRRFRQYDAIGRMKPGVSVDAAQAEMTAVAATLAKDYSKDDGGWMVEVTPYQTSLVGDAKPTLLILLSGVVCVLLIACANIANLLLTRAAGRSREVAVRMAIGAGRSRLVRQWLTESTLLALGGGFAGLLVSLGIVPLLVANSPIALPRLDQVVVDGRLVVFTGLVSLVTGLLCGLAPALGIRGISVTALRSTGPVGTARHRWLRPALLVTQIGLAIMLLVGAGLMARTLIAVYGLELGFDPRQVLTFTVNLGRARAQYRDLDQYRIFTRDFTARLRQQPGVENAGVGGLPVGSMLNNSFLADGRDTEIDAILNVPGPGYFESLKIPLRSGRYFTDADETSAPRVAVVNQAFARTAWDTTDAVNRVIRYDTKSPPITVIGVVDDIRVGGLETPAPPMVFIPYLQSTIATYSNFVLRSSGDPHQAIPLVKDVLKSVDPIIALSRITTMEEKVAAAIAPRQFNAWLIGLFSILAVILAVVGIYGLVGETVASRTPEIGVRMALGASRFQVVKLVVGSSLVIMAAGLILGLAGAAATTRSLGSMLFGVQPLDPITLVVVPIVFLTVAAIAALVPARRATRVDPVKALRAD